MKWLLRLDCKTISLNVQCDDSPTTGKVGEALTLSALITQNAECIAGGVLVTNVLSDGLELISYELSSPGGISDTDVVRIDRLDTGLLSRFPKLSKQDQYRISLSVIPRHGGQMTNRFAAVVFPFKPVYCEQVILVEDPCDKETAVLRAEVSPTGELTLVASGREGCRFVIESSTDLRNWIKLSEVGPTPTGERVPLVQQNSETRFFHLILKP